MKIIFHTLKYQNFLSSGNELTEIDLDQSPLTVIIGKNGSGKSTILDALSFVLFNKPFRKINKNQIINSITRKNCLVEIEFSIGEDRFKIIRGIKPNKFEIYKNDGIVDQIHSGDYQEFLEKNILRVNHKAFCQVVVLGKASYVPFMELPTPQRREIIENLLDLEIFTAMNVIAKKMNVENDKAIHEAEVQKTLQENILKSRSDYSSKRQEENEKKILLWKKKLNELKDCYISNKAEFDEIKEISNYDIENIKESLRQFNIKEKDLLSTKIKIQNKIDILVAEISFYEEHSDCPECKQHIDDNFKQELLTAKQETIKILHESLNQIIEHEVYNSSEIIKKQEEFDLICKENKERSLLKESMDRVTKEAKIIKSYMDDLKKETYEDTGEIESIKDKLKEIIEEFDRLNLEKKKLNIVLKLLKDEGIKAQIITQYIDIINNSINSYLLEMDFPCQFLLNENFEETIKSRYRDEFTYPSFSEGEKMRINLAILFTWYDIAKRRNSINTNILFFDEVLDGSLEADGIESLLNIIRRLTEGNNTFIISHNDKSIDLIDNVIKFEKKKGFSHIV